MADTSEQGSIKSQGAMEDFVLDPWTALSFKRALGDRVMAGVSWQSPGWVGDKHARRLIAYKIRHAYFENAARHMLPTVDSEKRKEHREYGDGALIVETIRASLLGDEQTVVVPGADDAEPDEEPTGLRRFLPRRLRRRERRTEEQEQATRALKLQDRLRDWGNDERLPQKLIETERNACKLGDGVYVLGWDARRNRPRLRCYDPGYYFPVLDDQSDDEYPRRVHIAYEIEPASGERLPGSKIKVRRITWELRRVGDQPVNPGEEAPAPLDLPWNDGPTDEQCYMSDGVWVIDKTGTEIDDFTEQSVTWKTFTDANGDLVEVHNLPLGIDFIPVVHIPNAVVLQAHYGAGVLDKVLQILDDLAQGDTDLWKAAELAGFPPLGLAKATLETDRTDTDGVRITTYGPGTVFEVGEGNITAVDLSAGLAALVSYIDHLLSRLEVNARVTAGALGRAAAQDYKSGVHLALSFGPMRTMVSEMRTVRQEKYRLVLRFVTRFFWINGEFDFEPPEVDPELEFGAFLPADKQEAVKAVTELLNAHAISLATALRILVDAGFPIEDAAEEVLAIQSENFEAAGQLLDLTDDFDLVREYIGIGGTAPPPPEPPEPVLPGPRPAGG